MTQERTPQGTPAGGQFATATHTESTSQLVAKPDRVVTLDLVRSGDTVGPNMLIKSVVETDGRYTVTITDRDGATRGVIEGDATANLTYSGGGGYSQALDANAEDGDPYCFGCGQTIPSDEFLSHDIDCNADEPDSYWEKDDQ